MNKMRKDGVLNILLTQNRKEVVKITQIIL